MTSLRMEFAHWNAAQQRARDAYAYLRAREDAPKRNRRPCRVCGTRTEAAEGFCLRCREGARHDAD